MEYTVKALADLAGVTPRTLRWYDRIGLLKPLRTTEAGYRLYGPAQLDRLQDILFYRELGLDLASIRTILDDPAFGPPGGAAEPPGRAGGPSGPTGRSDPDCPAND